MLFISISRPEWPNPYFLNKVNGIELRLDLFPSINLDFLQRWIKEISVPVMFTFRKNCAEKESIILELLKLKPEFCDLEYDMKGDFLVKTIEEHPSTQFILSYHNFEKTPDDLEAIYKEMKKISSFGYKIACMSKNANDALRMLLLSKKHSDLSTICMGECGAFARSLGPVVGNLIDYACIDRDEKTAPGQLTVSELTDIYRYPALNPQTSLYGLIGDPVEQSRGHLYHNNVFAKGGINSIYVKMNVKPEDLAEFFSLAKQLGFLGLSVTMPLKQAILSYIDHKDSLVLGCASSNTLLITEGKIWGTNTDGEGALDAIERKVKIRNKRVVLIGAGGSSRAIAFEAKSRGADLWILNRTEWRAKELALFLGCHYGSLFDFPPSYDILINCSPDPMPIHEEFISPKALVMDIVYTPKETMFLRKAIEKGCDVIYGEEMFLNQAALQTKFWS
jgi:3-dehydroquinate dehydratase / shikimate dehydrogenase